MMSELREALSLQREALQALAECQAKSGAWVDDQRRSLDSGCLEPLAADGRKLHEAMKRASQEILAAQATVAG
jgi:hypothetical protein